ncbi:MAG: hypothetical protein AAF447_11080 [Myxococcota bacterium]
MSSGPMPHVRGVLALASLLVLSAPAALRAQAGDAAPGEGERAAAVDAAMASAATRLLARDYAGAETVTREALGLDASRPALHCALGDALAGQGSRDAAFEAYASCRERAQALAQVVAEGRALMGRARLALRQPDDARAADALAALQRPVLHSVLP